MTVPSGMRALQAWLRALVGLLGLGALQAAAASHAPADVQIDGSRSRVVFELPLFLVGSVQGRFEQVRGSVRERSDGLTVCAEVNVASARMRRQRDTDELLGANFFNAAQFPQLRFVSAPVARADLQTGQPLAGRLTVRGIVRPVRFKVVQMQCPDPLQSANCRLVVEGAIRRGEFGMRARRGVLGDAVALRMEIQMCAAGALCPAAASSCD